MEGGGRQRHRKKQAGKWPIVESSWGAWLSLGVFVVTCEKEEGSEKHGDAGRSRPTVIMGRRFESEERIGTEEGERRRRRPLPPSPQPQTSFPEGVIRPKGPNTLLYIIL